jgi:vancomycin resistance protein YoaR
VQESVRQVPEPLGGRRSRRRRPAGPLIVAALLIALAAAFAAAQLWLSGRVGPGVSVAGVSIGTDTRREAATALSRALAERLEVASIETPKGVVETTLEELGIGVDLEASLDAALAAGRRDLALGMSVWLPAGSEVEPVVRVDQETFDAGLAAVRDKTDVPARDARLRWDADAGRLGTAAGADGVELDAETLRDALLAAVRAGRPFQGAAPTRPVPPQVTTADVEARLPIARLYLARPLVLRARDRRVILEPEIMAGMLAVNRRADAQAYPLTFDTAESRRVLHELFAGSERPPLEAVVSVDEDGRMTVSQSSAGLVLDMESLLADLDDAASGGGLRQVHVVLVARQPRLSTEDVEHDGLASVGSQFITYFEPSNAARAQNIARAAALVDGTVVAPGEIFSLNETMGPRSVNRGFDYAPVIAGDGVLRQGVGGGICQYATTLFNAVFFAGLQVVERHPHGFYIDHYPVGRDATVSWGGPDLKFRNDSRTTLTIRSWVTRNALTVALVGDTGREVGYETGPFTGITRPRSTRQKPRVVYDRDLPDGVVRWERGDNGRSVVVRRTVREGDRVVRRDEFRSSYDARDWIKRVGTGD